LPSVSKINIHCQATAPLVRHVNRGHAATDHASRSPDVFTRYGVNAFKVRWSSLLRVYS